MTLADHKWADYRERTLGCPNSAYLWHRIDGYCKECAVSAGIEIESAATIQARRNEQGYR